jgi:hypothetical protein
MSPESIVKVIEMIENKPKEKKLFIKRVIQAFKQDKYNIKDLSFKDLTYFIGLVADNQIEDIEVFQLYLDRAFSFELWDKKTFS